MDIRIGPSGNADSFYAEGKTSSVQAPEWLHQRGLNAYEYSLGHGISLTEETARLIGREGEKWDVRISVHAPYYINLANPDPERQEKSVRYILDSARRATWLQGDRVVVHVGAQQKQMRGDALRRCAEGLLICCRELSLGPDSGVRLCPETMGRPGQIGDLQEILSLCRENERLIPCIDFAHLHALGQGAMDSLEAFARALDETENALGLERARGIHIHFSTIEYTAKGEKRHRTFAEKSFGPDFAHLAPLLAARKYHPTIICECHGTQAEDAAAMMSMMKRQSVTCPSSFGSASVPPS